MKDQKNQQSGGFGRRLFLKAAAAGGILMALPRQALGIVIEKFPVRTVEVKNWTFKPESGMIQWESGDVESYGLVLDGMVKEPVSLSYSDVKDLSKTEQVSDFHCVEGWSVIDQVWGGFRFSELIKKVRVLPEAGYVVFHSVGQTVRKPRDLDHYLESFPINRLLEPAEEIILATRLNGRPLHMDHGAPLRLISPYDLGYKSIKFVTRIEFTDKPADGWWTRSNPIYSWNAPVPKRRLRKKRN